MILKLLIIKWYENIPPLLKLKKLEPQVYKIRIDLDV